MADFSSASKLRTDESGLFRVKRLHIMRVHRMNSEFIQLRTSITASCRLMDSNTGQFTILAAGLTGAGTAAAGEFISSPQLLDSAYSKAPNNWMKSNSIFVLKTKVTDGVWRPPSVVASYYWSTRTLVIARPSNP